MHIIIDEEDLKIGEKRTIVQRPQRRHCTSSVEQDGKIISSPKINE